MLDLVKLGFTANSGVLIASIVLEATYISKPNYSSLIQTIFHSQIMWLDGIVICGVILALDFLSKRRSMVDSLYESKFNTEQFEVIVKKNEKIIATIDPDIEQDLHKIAEIFRQIIDNTDSNVPLEKDEVDRDAKYRKIGFITDAFWGYFERCEVGLAFLPFVLCFAGMWCLIRGLAMPRLVAPF